MRQCYPRSVERPTTSRVVPSRDRFIPEARVAMVRCLPIVLERGGTMRRFMLLVALFALAMLSIGVPGAAAAGLSLTLVKAGFDSPVYVTNAGDSRLFVVEQSGRIKIVKSDGSVSTFVDLSGVVSQDGGERGLLGLAFHPKYASNGLFYVTYTRASDEDDVVAEYHVTANP